MANYMCSKCGEVVPLLLGNRCIRCRNEDMKTGIPRMTPDEMQDALSGFVGADRPSKIVAVSTAGVPPFCAFAMAGGASTPANRGHVSAVTATEARAYRMGRPQAAKLQSCLDDMETLRACYADALEPSYLNAHSLEEKDAYRLRLANQARGIHAQVFEAFGLSLPIGWID